MKVSYLVTFELPARKSADNMRRALESACNFYLELPQVKVAEYRSPAAAMARPKEPAEIAQERGSFLGEEISLRPASPPSAAE